MPSTYTQSQLRRAFRATDLWRRMAFAAAIANPAILRTLELACEAEQRAAARVAAPNEQLQLLGVAA